MSLGEAVVNIRANLAPLSAGLKKAFSMVKGSITAIGKKVINAGKWIGAALIGVGIASVKMAADMEESENLFEVSMGNMAKSTREWSDELSNALGLNAYSVRKMVSTFNVMLGSMGFTEKASADMSKEMTKLAYDMASFYNLPVEEAFQKLQAGITGEAEPLKRLGILINEAKVSQTAYTSGIAEQGAKLTDLQKIQARFTLIMGQTEKAQGDLARTSDSLTNVWRAMVEKVKEIMATFGKGLIPVVTKVASAFKEFLNENKPMFEQWGVAVGNALSGIVDYFTNIFDIAKTKGLSEAFKVMMEDACDALTAGWEYMKNTVMPIVIEIGTILAEAFCDTFGEKLAEGLEHAFDLINPFYHIDQYIKGEMAAKGAVEDAYRMSNDIEYGMQEKQALARTKPMLDKFKSEGKNCWQQVGRMGDKM